MESYVENKIDISALIEKYGTGNFQDFEGFTCVEEQQLIVNEIKKCLKCFDYKDTEFLQALGDIVLIKSVGEFNEGDEPITYHVDRVIELMSNWYDILSCRYLLKSGINWLEEKEGIEKIEQPDPPEIHTDVKYWDENDITFKKDCRWSCSCEHGWYCYKRINSNILVQDLPCTVCHKFERR